MNFEISENAPMLPLSLEHLTIVFLRPDGVVIGYDKNPSSHPFPDEAKE